MESLRPGIVIVCLTLLGCQAGLPQRTGRLEDEGAVYLYLQPLPREAERLRVGVQAVSALHADGREFPLSVSLRELNGRDVRRQRLLAAGSLPAGDYSGLVFRATRASLAGEEGDSALLVPDSPTRIHFPFTVRRREGYVIALVLEPEPVEAGFRFSPAFSVFFPDRPAVGLMGFVANSGSDDVTVFDKKSLEVFAVIATGGGPSGLALDQRARRLYIALSGEDAVEVVDVLSGRVVDRIVLTPGDEPVALALTPDGASLLAANRGSSTVSLIDPRSRVELLKIRVGHGPRSIATDRTGRRAFVFDALASTVSVVDVPAGAVIRSIPTDPGPVRGQLNRRGDRLYVVHEMTPYITVIDPLALAVTARFPVRSGMEAIKVDPNTDLVYLGGRREFGVGVHEPFAFGLVDVVQTGTGVAHMATDGEENALYLVSPDTNRVLVFHRIRKTPVGELDVGVGPAWVAVMGEN